MTNRYRVSIGGTYLDQLLQNDKRFKDKVVMLNVGYAEPGISRTIETAGDNDGGIVTRTYRQRASVTITFGLYIYNTADRYEACEAIKTLASKGGTVITNDRPNRALYNCVCDQYPEIDSARDWTEPLTMVFSSYAFPYWQNQTATVKSLTGTKTESTITVPGNAPKAICTMEITAAENFPTNLNGTILKVTVDSTFLNINYPLKKNNYCLIDQDEKNNLRIRIYDNSSSSKKLIASGIGLATDSSSDKLVAIPGKANKFAIQADKKITAKLSVRGAWL